MTPLSLFQAHRGFFELDHARSTDAALSEARDAVVIEALLDPDRIDPPAPNRIFDAGHYTLERMRLGMDGPVNPVTHYLTLGALQGRSINALFDRVFYAKTARVADPSPLGAVLHALAHFDTGLVRFSPFVDPGFLSANTGRGIGPDFLCDLFAGRLQHDRPHPLIDLAHIRTQVEQRLDTLQDAILHYWNCGKDLSTHPLFDVDFYRSQVAGRDHLAHSVYHYLTSQTPPSPHPLFDPDFYAERARAVLGRVPNPSLEHFLTIGQAAGLSPSPYFEATHYRARSGCDESALLHYLTGGHRHYEPHPLIDISTAQLLERAQPPTGKTVAELLATSPADVPLSVTPDFSPSHHAKMYLPTETSPQVLREHYFRFGYRAGRRPNGLLSMPYIKAQAQLLAVDHPDPLAAYFERGWQRRKRLLVVLPTMEDTTVNRAFLGLCAAQLANSDLEIVVATAMPGPMSASFFEVAHVWHLADPPLHTMDPAVLRSAVTQLGRVLAANPALVTLVDAGAGASVVAEFAQFGPNLAVFGDTGLSRLSLEDAAQLVDLTDLILCDGDAVRQLLLTIKETSRHKLAPGLMAETVSVAPSSARRDRVRQALGLDDAAVVILSSGTGTLADGADLFGALAGLCGDGGDAFQDATFLWHGSTASHPNTPLFYAAHFAGLAEGGAARFRKIDAPAIDAVLSAADIYVNLGRDGGGDGGAARAARAGLPVLMMEQPTDATLAHVIAQNPGLLVGRYDLAAARDVLRRLVSDPQARRLRIVDAETTGLPGFIARTDGAIRRLVPDIGLVDADHPCMGKMLLIVPDKSFIDALAEHATRKTTGRGMPILWFDLARARVPDMPQGIAALIHDSGCREIAIAGAVEALDAAEIEAFDRSVLLARGSAAEMGVLYTLGMTFDRVLTRRPSQIEEMSAINPRVAASMSVLDWGRP
ncbi:hypothetical protein [Roseicyclus mahoneyensis]|uniref:Uncharacterized protein n=1 Tax=Roseicyclus mahoneyensis TaxID=164332 RepID=A0A316GQD4_9RHOB|nr:hypothetical protein [Roseicyclus mahoneyensis]PWK62929.1 hypothetical protein C7455_101970 [Roseicyclus mahoneyensis]